MPPAGTYHRLDPRELEATPDHPCDRRSISDDAGLAMLASAVYELDPGEQLPQSYHYHEQREELFFVHSGSLSVETPDKTFELTEGEIFVAEPNSPHRPYNPVENTEPTTVLGVGAPRSDIARPYDPEE